MSEDKPDLGVLPDAVQKVVEWCKDPEGRPWPHAKRSIGCDVFLDVAGYAARLKLETERLRQRAAAMPRGRPLPERLLMTSRVVACPHCLGRGRVVVPEGDIDR